jgi:hypothetical protein
VFRVNRHKNRNWLPKTSSGFRFRRPEGKVF